MFSYYLLLSLIVQDINQACSNKPGCSGREEEENCSKVAPLLCCSWWPELPSPHSPQPWLTCLPARPHLPAGATQLPGQVSLGWIILSVNFLPTAIDKNGTSLVWATHLLRASAVWFLMQRKHKHYGMLNIPYILNSAYISLLILLTS